MTFPGTPSPAAPPEEERGRLAMKLFLASLGMLFAASMVGYAVIRLRAADGIEIRLPGLLWFSTAAILAAGLALQRGLAAARTGRQAALRRALPLALGLSLLFLALQAPGLAALLRSHAAMREQDVHLYALVSFLVVLHAAHVVGGLAPLVRVTARAWREPAACIAPRHGPLRAVAWYWHFLEAVWLIMFLLLLLLG
jgi:heme/copper-type cytochrome/quinol oxidase subunit 3